MNNNIVACYPVQKDRVTMSKLTAIAASAKRRILVGPLASKKHGHLEYNGDIFYTY